MQGGSRTDAARGRHSFRRLPRQGRRITILAMDEQTTLRARKKARTREALQNAAMVLFVARGFDAATVDEIATAAEVSQRTFFRHFPTKEAVVFAQHGERMERFRALLAGHEESMPPVDAVRATLRSIARDYMEDREALLAEYRVVTASPALTLRDLEHDSEYEAAIAAALVRGAPAAPPRDLRILAGAVMGAIRAAMTEWFAAECQGDLEEIGQVAFRLLVAGMREIAARS